MLLRAEISGKKPKEQRQVKEIKREFHTDNPGKPKVHRHVAEENIVYWICQKSDKAGK